MSEHARQPEVSADVEPTILTAESIQAATGYKLVVVFPRFMTDPAARVSFHDELERLGNELKWQNVIGSLYYEEDKLVLGIFADAEAIATFRTQQRDIPPLDTD